MLDAVFSVFKNLDLEEDEKENAEKKKKKGRPRLWLPQLTML